MLRFLRRMVSGPAPTPIPDDAWAALLERVVWFDDLTPDELLRLRDYTGRFLSAKRFVGASGLVVDDDMRLVIAALASWPVLHLGHAALRGWTSVIVYPEGFRAKRTDEDELTGVITEYHEDLAGEAWERGPLILSWADIEEDLAEPDDGVCVVVHEIAHKLDEGSGEVNGMPRLPRGVSPSEWASTFTRAFRALEELLDQGRDADSLIDPYAAHSPEEFFAVCSEYVLCRPDLLAEQFPEVERLLRLFYGHARPPVA